MKGIAAAMHFRSEDDPQAQELAALIADKGPQAALAQISGPDAASDVVAEAVNDYNAENDAQPGATNVAPITTPVRYAGNDGRNTSI